MSKRLQSAGVTANGGYNSGPTGKELGRPRNAGQGYVDWVIALVLHAVVHDGKLMKII